MFYFVKLSFFFSTKKVLNKKLFILFDSDSFISNIKTVIDPFPDEQKSESRVHNVSNLLNQNKLEDLFRHSNLYSKYSHDRKKKQFHSYSFSFNNCCTTTKYMKTQQAMGRVRITVRVLEI
jgi:hypothetical protein